MWLFGVIEEEEEGVCAMPGPGLRSFGTLLILKAAKQLIEAEDQTGCLSKTELE